MRDGKREWIWYSDIDYDASEFPDIGRQFEESFPEYVRRGTVGSAESRLLPVKQIVDFAVDWLSLKG